MPFSFEPVFVGAPFAASGERIDTPPETLNTTLETLFEYGESKWQKANLNGPSRT
jgi:hypothetical protein